MAEPNRRWISATGKATECPYCGSLDTVRSAAFGPFHMTESYSCRSCKSPFSRLKHDGTDSPGGAPELGA